MPKRRYGYAKRVDFSKDSIVKKKGYGSNLTLGGTVECDAAVMDGRTGDFGSVGAVPGQSETVS